MTILGHSMGSVILRRYLQKDYKAPEKAVIMGTLPRYGLLSGGGMFMLSWLSGLFVSGSKRHRFVNRLMDRSMVSNIPDATSNLNWLAHDKDVVNHYDEDPLSGFVYNKYFYNSFFKSLIALNKSSEIAKTPAIKTLFISGYDDPLSKKMKAIHRLAGVYEKLVDGFDGEVKTVYKARHEVLNEKNKSDTYDVLSDWILNR
ncbi:MAG: serine aminopeptidase domain-containing protein [Bacillota bacterium]